MRLPLKKPVNEREFSFRLVLIVLVATAVSPPLQSQFTQRVDLATNGQQSRFGAELPSAPSTPVVSGDGRFVAFMSFSSTLVPGDTNGKRDIFLRDRRLGITERIDVSSGGGESLSGGSAFGIMVSPDGRYVVWDSSAPDLVPGDTNQMADVFVRDRVLGTTERVSVGPSGTESNGPSIRPSISADGRYVAFMSEASNLVAGDTNGLSDDFVYDRSSRTTLLVSESLNGMPGNGNSSLVAISGDGHSVAFISDASDLVAGDTNSSRDVFVRDLPSGATTRVSVSSQGVQGDGFSDHVSISKDGRYVAFASVAQNLVAGDLNHAADVFVHDRTLGTTERVSIASDGSDSAGYSDSPAMSGDGRYIAFQTTGKLTRADVGYYDIYVRDRALLTTSRVSVTNGNTQAHGDSNCPAMSEDGHTVAFSSSASNLVPGDMNSLDDVFVRDINATHCTYLCEAGVNGVTTCPCGNPPLGPGRGCDNSSATGGASLAASGLTYLSADTLEFRSEGESLGALSVLLGGRRLISSGAVYGHGVRCLSGSLIRLYAKRAFGGSITAPDRSAGEAAISVRSAYKGDHIHPGDIRWYVIAYRDGAISTGCSAGGSFNMTPSAEVTWWP